MLQLWLVGKEILHRLPRREGEIIIFGESTIMDPFSKVLAGVLFHRLNSLQIFEPEALQDATSVFTRMQTKIDKHRPFMDPFKVIFGSS